MEKEPTLDTVDIDLFGFAAGHFPTDLFGPLLLFVGKFSGCCWPEKQKYNMIYIFQSGRKIHGFQPGDQPP